MERFLGPSGAHTNPPGSEQSAQTNWGSLQLLPQVPWFSHKNYFSSSHNIFFCRRDFIFKILVLTAAAAAAFGASPCKVISFFRKKSILNISRIATTWTGMPAEQESSLASQRPPRHLLPQRLTLKLTTCSPKKLLMSRLKKKRKGRTVRFISQIILYHQSNPITRQIPLLHKVLPSGRWKYGYDQYWCWRDLRPRFRICCSFSHSMLVISCLIFGKLSIILNIIPDFL